MGKPPMSRKQAKPKTERRQRHDSALAKYESGEIEEVEFTHDPEDFKGPQESCMGVDIHYIADTIRWSACKGISFYPLLVEPQSVTLASTSTGAAIGIKSPRFTGLGSQFRTDIEAVRKVLAKAS